MIQTVRTPLKIELVIIPCEAASSNCQGSKQRHTLPTKPPYSYRPTLHKHQRKEGHSKLEPRDEMHQIHASKKLPHLWFNFGPYPFSLFFPASINPFHAISPRATPTTTPRCPAKPAIGQLLGLRRARHQKKKLQHIAEIATDSLSKPGSESVTARWWKETMGIGWDTVSTSTFNQCTGMLQPKPQPEQQDHWHLSTWIHESSWIHGLLPLNVRGGLAQWP